MFDNTYNNLPLGALLDGLETPGLLDHGYAAGKRIDFLKLPVIGEGGEGWILNGGEYRSGEVIKLFKPPQMTNFPEQAREKWDEYPKKLPELEQVKLPAAAAAPTCLVSNTQKKSKIIAYFMPGIEGTDLSALTTKEGRTTHGYSKNRVMSLFKEISSIASELHKQGCIIGDQKPDNFRITRGHVRLMDIESIAFGEFKCHGFTPAYVDPLICDPTLDYLNRIKNYSTACDHYSSAVMLFECLAGINPFDGIHQPLPNEREVPDSALALHRLSVLNSAVGVPSFIETFKSLSPALLEYFRKTFEGPLRDPLTDELLNTKWQACEECDIEHAYCQCPLCAPVNKQVLLQYGTLPARPAAIEASRKYGMTVHFGLDSSGEKAIAAHVATNNSQLHLLVNGKVAVKNISPSAAIAAIPASDTIYLQKDNKIKLYSNNSAHARVLNHVRFTDDNRALFAAQRAFIAFINTSGDLVLASTTNKNARFNYKVQTPDATHFSVGRKAIAIGTPRSVVLAYTPENAGYIERAVLEHSGTDTLVSLQTHASEMLVLATYRSLSGKNFSCKVFDQEGSTILALEAKKPTTWWLSNRMIDNQPTVLYWQNEKLCEAVLSTKNRSIKRMWGISPIPHPDPDLVPLIFGNRIFLTNNGEISTIALT